MKIKKGDKVKVITGSDKGTVATVKTVFPSKSMILVDGVNMKTKHLKPSQENPDGGKIEFEAPIHVSNVMAYDSKAKTASRITFKEEKDKKVRVFTKTGATLK